MRRGIGGRLLEVLMAQGARLGGVQAWGLTGPDNVAAQQLYRTAGGRAAEPSAMLEFPLDDREPRIRVSGPAGAGAPCQGRS